MAESPTGDIMTDSLIGDLLTLESLDYSLPDFSSCWTDDCNISNEITDSIIGNTDGNLNFSQVLYGLDKIITTNIDEGSKNELEIVKPAKNGTKKLAFRKGQRYTESFKRKVLDYAVKHTFKETALKFNVNTNTLTEWAREYKRLLQLKKSTTARPGFKLKTDLIRNAAINETEDQNDYSSCAKFLDWLKVQRVRGTQLRREDVLAVGLDLLNKETKDNDCHWFPRWVQRLNGQTARSGADAHKADKHIFYPDDFKLEVALFAKEYTKIKAAQVFGISSRRIYAWCTPDPPSSGVSQLKQLVESQLKGWYEQRLSMGTKPKGREVISEAKTLYAAHGLNQVKCSQGWLEKFQKRANIKMSHIHDDKLLMWILAELDNNRSLSLTKVTQKSQILAAETKFNDFKGSKGWTLRFLKRYSPLLQSCSTRLDLMPSSAIAESRSFCTALQTRICAAGISSDCIGCLDEVAINFNFPSEKVHTPRLIRQANLLSSSAVVMLSATSDGRLLPPAVVIKGPKIQQMLFQDIIPVIYHENGSVDTQVLDQWFQQVWMRFVKAPSVLVADCFDPHVSHQFQENCSTGNCHLAIIPPGCALHLQPCSFNLARRYQETIQEEWLKYSSSSACVASPNAVPDEMTIVKWALKSYKILATDTTSIRSSFQLTGLTATDKQFEAGGSPNACL